MSSSISGLPAIPQYLADMKDESASAARFAQTNPQTRTDLDAFRKVAPDIASADDLLGNYRALNVVLQAYGLSSLSGQTAVVRDLLTQPPDAPTSLAHRSGNTAWQSFAKAFSNWSPSPFASHDTVSGISDKYLLSRFEAHSQTETPGLGNALYFTRNVHGASSLAQIMADPTMLKVVVTVAGFDPTQFGALDYDEQVRLLKPQVDLTAFSTEKGVQRYAEQYLGILQINPEPTKTPATLLSLYGTASDSSILSLFTGPSRSSTPSLLSALA